MCESFSPKESLRNVTQEDVSVNRQRPQGKKHIVKAAGLMGGMTLLSRILGMARDVVSARAFGTGWHWDAFVYAFMVPNFFRRIVGEGALASAFVPVYNETLARRGLKEATRFVNVLLTALIAGFFLFLVVVELVLQGLLGLHVLPQPFHLIVDLLRFFFPYLAFISFYALGMGVLNSHRHFFAPSLGPVLMNVFWIGGIFWITAFKGHLDFSGQLRWLAVILFLSGLAQLAVEVPFLYRVGYRPKWLWDFGYPPLKRMIELVIPVVLGFAVVQINLLVDSTLAFCVGPGANSVLWYGNRLMQFPLGVFAIAMGTALLPTIAHQMARGEMEEAKKNISFSLGSIFLIVLPCSLGLIALRVPIVRLLFEHGEFDPVATGRTAAVLFAYSVGLFAYSGQRIIVSGFYAIQDTRTPVRVGVISLLVNIVFNLILMIPLREAGLALATSIAGIVQFVILVCIFHRKISPLDMRGILISFLKIFLASLGMALAAVAGYDSLGNYWAGDETWAQGCRVFGSIGLATLSYVLFCLLFRVREMNDLIRFVTEKIKRTRASA